MPSRRCYTPNLPYVRVSKFQNLGNFCLQNPESWASESEIQLKESRIQNPSSTYKDWNPVPSTVDSLYCGQLMDLEFVSSIVRVRNSGILFQSNVCNLFLPGIQLLPILSGCPLQRGVHRARVGCIWNPWHGIQKPRLGFPYMWRA